MTIYEMTATFGKLEHAVLTLKPGLNIIEAPNEWGKSTWCAFLIAMLYGIDTRERTKQDSLADKERYAPWSGSPMSGRIDLCWEGRDITIERSTRGRGVFGQFRAYETATGLDIPELTAANCGQTLLGVEKSVFTRAGFLRLTDLPVTQDESLRRRLNALVTTGDESGASDVLAQKLRDLKNQCRSNRANGLIPKAEYQREELEDKLRQIQQLREQSQRIQLRQESLGKHIQNLENHQTALEYAATQDHVQKAAAARLQLEQVASQIQQLKAQCAGIPSAEDLLQKLSRLQQLREQKEALQMQAQMRPAAPVAPVPPSPFLGCTGEQAIKQAQADAAAYEACEKAKKKHVIWPILAGIALVLTSILALAANMRIPGLILLVLGIGCLLIGVVHWNVEKRKHTEAQILRERLLERYRPWVPSQWEDAARQYVQAQLRYEEAMAAYSNEGTLLQEQLKNLNGHLLDLTEGASYIQREQEWKTSLEQHKALADAIREQRRMEELIRSFDTDREQPRQPAFPDTLTFTQPETARLLSDAEFEKHQLQLKLGHCQGQIEALGLEAPLRQQLDAVNSRLARLEDTYAALEIAQTTLQEASKELQRRFAPRISRRAQELFGVLTGSRYDRLSLGEDLSLRAGAQGEDTLHGALWRSDGTVDQLYLALRLAVAEELTPDAPLILDDVLVRFDDTRLASAMQILQMCAENKQVILFTCQSRERALLERK